MRIGSFPSGELLFGSRTTKPDQLGARWWPEEGTSTRGFHGGAASRSCSCRTMASLLQSAEQARRRRGDDPNVTARVLFGGRTTKVKEDAVGLRRARDRGRKKRKEEREEWRTLQKTHTSKNAPISFYTHD